MESAGDLTSLTEVSQKGTCSDDLNTMTLLELISRLRRRQVSAREVIAVHLDAIHAQDPFLGAWVEVLGEAAMESAHAIDDGRARGDGAGPLGGVPLAVKDNIETAAGGTRYGSRVFEHNRAAFDAGIVARLRTAGGIVLGKTATPEFALAAITTSELHGPTRNPWLPDHSPGGSSGGSAVAVAAGMATIGVGNDGGGSVRLPAACSGVVGLKPSRGRLPWGPPAPEHWNGLTTHGLFGRSVADVAWTLQAVAGADPEAPYAPHPLPVDPAFDVWQPTRHLTVAVQTAGPYADVDPEIVSAVERCADAVRQLGHTISAAVPDFSGLRDEFLTLGGCGFAAAFPLRQEKEVEEYSRHCYQESRTYSGQDYAAALDRARRRSAVIASAWRDIDVLLTPTMSVLAPRLSDADGSDQWSDYLGWAQFTFPFNITGQPALSIPIGMAHGGLPIGVQLVGSPGREDVILNLAAQLEWAGVSQFLPPPMSKLP